MYVCCSRSEEKRKEKKNERNMRSRFDNQLEAAAFKRRCNTSPNEREILFAIQLVKHTTEQSMFNLQIMTNIRIFLIWCWWFLALIQTIYSTSIQSKNLTK
jgi:hypothetical protein